MRLRKDPYLVRRARSVRTARHKIADRLNDPASLPQLLRQDVAKNAAFFLAVVILPGAKLVQHAPRDERAGGQLRSRVREVLPGDGAVVLKDGDVLESLVLFQVLDPLPRQAQEPLDLGVAGIP